MPPTGRRQPLPAFQLWISCKGSSSKQDFTVSTSATREAGTRGHEQGNQIFTQEGDGSLPSAHERRNLIRQHAYWRELLSGVHPPCANSYAAT